MQTTHRILASDARQLSQIRDASIDLVVTSPPYPMIEMWDGLFSDLSEEVKSRLDAENGMAAFEAMHLELDRVWKELFRVLKEGRFACINIGDATRSLGKTFQLFSNHTRILFACQRIGFTVLPFILWRKQTNAPTKFMGSGMLPGGAYVTLEHEYILILRKGGRRKFITSAEKERRQKSAFFWEERNRWFCDVWDFKGSRQELADKHLRKRSAAFPFELAYRLVQMYSLQGDLVLDPFVGTGTSSQACIASARNSIGIELDKNLSKLAFKEPKKIKEISLQRWRNRIQSHEAFVSSFIQKNGPLKHFNIPHGFFVVSKQETNLELLQPKKIIPKGTGELDVLYEPP